MTWKGIIDLKTIISTVISIFVAGILSIFFAQAHVDKMINDRAVSMEREMELKKYPHQDGVKLEGRVQQLETTLSRLEKMTDKMDNLTSMLYEIKIDIASMKQKK